MSEHYITYKFIFPDETAKEFTLHLDEDLNMQIEKKDSYPTWCELYFYKCPICTLEDNEEYCSVAIALSELFSFFHKKSYSGVGIEVTTEQRVYKKDVTMQKAMSSVMGLVMASSSCPILSKLKPFVKLHLPFANSEETISKIISTYLLAQYYKSRKGIEPDWELTGLKKIYDDISIVNKSFFKRVQNSFSEDVDTNAITILESFANCISFSLDGIMETDLQKILLKSF